MNIKQLIEEERKKYANSNGIYNEHGERLLSMGFNKGANFVLSKWQEANRWREVEKEEPPFLKDVLFTVHIYAENYQSESYTIGHRDSSGYYFQRNDSDIFEIVPTHWRYIEV